MKRIDEFLDHIYTESNLDLNEKKEMKEEMKSHLLDYIKEATENGLTEEQAIIEALEHFGKQNDIFDQVPTKTQRKKWNYWMITSVLVLCGLILSNAILFVNEQFKLSERTVFTNILWSELYQNAQLNHESIKYKVLEAKNKRTINDVLIKKGSGESAPIILKTIGSEGFPQFDSWIIKTETKQLTTSHPNSNEVYSITYSYNNLNYPTIIVLNILFILIFSGLFIIGIRIRNKKVNP